MITVKVIVENKTEGSKCLAEHGLSILVETGEKNVLFDTGAGKVFLKNAYRMEIDLNHVDALVISHGHYDHTGGVPDFCQANDHANVYIHEKAFQRTYSLRNGKLGEEHSGIRWNIAQFDELRHRLKLTKGVTYLSEDIVISGTIPDVEGYEMTEKFYKKGENGELTADLMEHEQFLAVRDRTAAGESKGIYLFSGCSHKGIIPCLRYAKELFPGEPILGLLAGLHLYSANEETRNRVIEEVIAEDVKTVIPVHCTGLQAICALKAKMQDRCILAGAGDTIMFDEK